MEHDKAQACAKTQIVGSSRVWNLIQPRSQRGKEGSILTIVSCAPEAVSIKHDMCWNIHTSDGVIKSDCLGFGGHELMLQSCRHTHQCLSC